MSYSFTQRKRIRKSFGKYNTKAEMPNLIEIQKNSYDQFLQKEVAAEKRKTRGLQAVFKSVFPVEDLAQTATVEFVKYDFGKPVTWVKHGSSYAELSRHFGLLRNLGDTESICHEIGYIIKDEVAEKFVVIYQIPNDPE
jgi:DNA-directed RNA polymerase beta subunit